MLTCLRVFVNKLTGFEIDPEIIRYIHQGMDDLIRQSLVRKSNHFPSPQNQSVTNGKRASGAPFADDDIDIGVDFGEEDYFWQNEPSNSAAPTASLAGEAAAGDPAAPTMPTTTTTTSPAKKEVKSPSKVVVIKMSKGSTGMTKKNRRAFSCVIEGCKFAAKYAKDLERHARTHTGKFCTLEINFNGAWRLVYLGAALGSTPHT